jgi:hypothetical protein
MRKRKLLDRLHLAALIAAIAMAAAISGCARVQPYQRGRLAHPTMLLGETATPGEAHVYAIHEGAVGGGSAVEGGCGCN